MGLGHAAWHGSLNNSTDVEKFFGSRRALGISACAERSLPCEVRTTTTTSPRSVFQIQKAASHKQAGNKPIDDKKNGHFYHERLPPREKTLESSPEASMTST